MKNTTKNATHVLIVLGLHSGLAGFAAGQGIGEEKGLPDRLAPGEEMTLPIRQLFDHGQDTFAANWTVQEGQGRPLTKGTGNPLSDPSSPLVFPRNMNRLSTPDANSCAGCHNAPITGGAGDFVTNVFVLAQRFDFATFDSSDLQPTRGNVNELGQEVQLQSIANSRQTIGMFGSGFIEMLARQVTADLQAIRDTIPPGGSAPLTSKGISYGTLARDAAGNWITTGVEGLPAPSLNSTGPANPPNLIIMPFHQAGAVISLRQFTNNAMNHHHGIQVIERFGAGNDPDGDGYVDELGIGDVSAASIYQAALDVPGRVLPRDERVRAAVRRGEQAFVGIGCSTCHVPSLPLDDRGWVFTEPNPYNPTGNLRPGDAYVQTYGALSVDLTSKELPGPRPKANEQGVVEVFAFTDLKLHDITSGSGDPNVEPLNMHAMPGSPAFFAGNRRFLSGKLWGLASQMPYYHHGQYTTIRQAVEAHAGEAAGVMANWWALAPGERDDIIEFLKSLRILPATAKSPVIDDMGHPVRWPTFPWNSGQTLPPLP